MKKKYLLCLWFYVTRRSRVVLSSASVLVMSALPMELSCWCCSPHPFKYVHLHGVVFFFCFFFPALVSDWAFRVEEVIAVLWGWINELSTLSDRKIIALSVFFCQSVSPIFQPRLQVWTLRVYGSWKALIISVLSWCSWSADFLSQVLCFVFTVWVLSLSLKCLWCWGCYTT